MATVACLGSLFFPLVRERTPHVVGGGLTPAPRHTVPSLANPRTPDPPAPALTWVWPQDICASQTSAPLGPFLFQESVMQLPWACQMVEGQSGPHMEMGREWAQQGHWNPWIQPSLGPHDPSLTWAEGEPSNGS